MNGPFKKYKTKRHRPLKDPFKKYENKRRRPSKDPLKKEVFAIGFAVLLALLVIVLSNSLTGSNDSTQINQPATQTSEIPTKTYAAGGISFAYPGSWNVTTDEINGSNMQVMIQDPASANNPDNKQAAAFTILKVQKDPYETLEQRKNAFIQSLTDSGANIAPSNPTNISVSGINAIETIYTGNGPNYEQIQLKLVYFEQNGIFYIMAFLTKGMDLESQKPYFDAIFNSFKLQ